MKLTKQVFLCYLTRSKKEKLVKIVSAFALAKKWEHETTQKLMEGELLYANYLKSLHWKRPHSNKDHTIRKNKHATAWFKFLRDNKFDGTEERSSAYFHGWDLDK